MYNSDSDNGAFTEYFSECLAECATHTIAFSNNNFSCSQHITYGVRQLMFLTSMFPALLLSLVVWRGICVIAEVVAEAMD